MLGRLLGLSLKKCGNGYWQIKSLITATQIFNLPNQSYWFNQSKKRGFDLKLIIKSRFEQKFISKIGIPPLNIRYTNNSVELYFPF